MREGKAILVSAFVGLLAAGCTIRLPEPEPLPLKKNYYRQLPPGAPALRKITDPARIPDFRRAFDGDLDGLRTALDHSIRYFTYPSSTKYYPVQEITHERAAGSLVAFREILDSVRTGAELHDRIVAVFDVYESVGCDDEGTVLFTGYYTPIFDARLAPTSEFCWPLHKLPPDLVKDEEGSCLGRRLAGGDTVPYYTRGEIARGALRGGELVYLKDAFEAYVCTVQGSARLRLADGSWYDVGYHGNNGKEYSSVGTELVKDGLIERSQVSLGGLVKFFRENPQYLDDYLARNERYVFFRESDGTPRGSLGLPVTPFRSIATDKSLFPRGALCFVTTRIPVARPGGSAGTREFRQLTLDQDTGGAIRAAGRCDIYIGIGDDAGKIAGWTFNEGRLYYLFLKDRRP